MYTREEMSRLRQAFWTAFGKYMQPVQSAEGTPANWINYKTGAPGIQFKMDADRDQAVIMILLSHKNADVQLSHYDQLVQMKAMLEEALGENDWVWQEAAVDSSGRLTSAISKTLSGVNVLKQADWPTIISFLKPRILALDEFWSMVKHSFEQ